jgi:phage gp29-like protein
MNRIQTLAAAAARMVGLEIAQDRSRQPAPFAEPLNLSSDATASTMRYAVRDAERGNPRDLFRLYRDFVLGDDHVQGCLTTRKLAVLGQPLVILPQSKDSADDKVAVQACRRAVADCEQWMAGLSAIMDSTFWPVSVAERIMRPADEPAAGEPRLQFTLRRLDQVSPFQFSFLWAYQFGAQIDPNGFEPYLKLWPLDADDRILYQMDLATPLDPNRHIVHRGHLMTGFRDNYGGPGRCVLGWVLLRQLGRDWFGRFMERYGSPFPKAKTDTKDPQKVSFLQNALSLATKIGGIVIDSEDEVDLVQAVTQGGAEGYKLWLDVCNNAISRAITGYDANSNPSGLNSGESQKQENVRDDVRLLDQILLGETLEKQVFAPFLKMNGLVGRVKVTFGGLSDADAKGFADMVNVMKQAGYELTDESINTANERTGLVWQRAAPPANPFGSPANQLATFAAMLPAGVHLPRVTHPSDGVASEHAKAVGAAMREAFQPALQIIQDSRSAAECEARLAALFADWRPKQFQAALEKPLQLCAAKGAADVKRQAAAGQ